MKYRKSKLKINHCELRELIGMLKKAKLNCFGEKKKKKLLQVLRISNRPFFFFIKLSMKCWDVVRNHALHLYSFKYVLNWILSIFDENSKGISLKT